MLKLADRVIRWRWMIIGVMLLITAFFGMQAMRVELNADFSTYLRQDDPLVQQYNRIGDIFGGNSVGVALLSADDVFTPQNLKLLQELTEAFKNVEGIAYVTSLTNVVDFRKTDWGLEVGELFDGRSLDSPQAIAVLKNYVMQKDRYVSRLVSEDGTTAAIVLRFQGGSARAINQFATSLQVKAAAEEVLERVQAPENTRLYFGGMPFLIFNMTLLITENLTVLVPLMVLILILTLYLGFRHWAGVVFPMLVVAISVIWVVGFMGMTGLQMDLLTGIAPVILLALGSADGIHLLKRYFERRRLGEPAREATRMVFKEMGTPIILTTITTTVGFAALAISDFAVIQQFGLLTALGIVIALVVTLTLLPALLSFGITPGPAKKQNRRIAPFGEALGRFIHRRKKAILIAAVGMVILSAVALPRIQKDVDWTLCLQKGSDPFHAEMLLREKFGGSLPIQILVDGDLRDPATLKLMHEIERRLEVVPGVSKSQSIASVLAEMNAVMNDRYTVPEDRQGVSNLWFLIEGREMMEQLVSRQETEALLQAKLNTWHTAFLVAAVDSIDRLLAPYQQPLAVVRLSEVSPEARSRLLQIRHQQMLADLKLDLRRHGLELPDNALAVVVDQALNPPPIPETGTVLTNAALDYLTGPEAEVELPVAVARRISRAIGQQLSRTAAPDSAVIQRIILRLAPGVDREDAGWLAGSLTAVLRDQLAELRLQPALRQLQQQIPRERLGDAELWRDLKGTLWQANEELLIAPEPQIAAALGEADLPTWRRLTVRVAQSGLAPVLKRMEEELTPTQVESLSITLMLVIILLALIFRSLTGGVLAVVPISLTILINFAVMGYLGIGLDSFTAMIASVAIGLGIDTDIHFISRLRDEMKKSRDALTALQHTLNTTGISIIINALAVGLGFLVLLAAGGQHIRRFGGLTAMTIFVSALFTLTVLPALLLWIKPKFLQQAASTEVTSREHPGDVADVVPSE
ncbi:MAG: MMPL family transporter [Calditrichaeota bacterium]|nr:MMPL family transporter [Calditrichota bacterium]